MNKKPVRVAVTGAAGQIGYALLFRIASGEMLGKGYSRREVLKRMSQTAEGLSSVAPILQLAADYREPLLLQLIFGMTGDEIATVLQLNLNTVNTRLFRGRAQLRARLQPDHSDGVSQHG